MCPLWRTTLRISGPLSPPMRQSATFSAAVFAGVLLLGLVLAAFLICCCGGGILPFCGRWACPRASGPGPSGSRCPSGAAGDCGRQYTSLGLRHEEDGGKPWPRFPGRRGRGGIGGAVPSVFGGNLCLRLGAAGGLLWPLGRAACPAVLPWSCCRVQQEGGRRGKDIAKATATGGEARKSVSAGEGAPGGKRANLAGADRCPQGAAPGTGARHGVSGRYVLRQIRRAPLKSALAMALALGFVVALGWMDLTAERSQAEADRLYETTVVEAKITQSNPSMSVGTSNIINKSTVDAILETGLVQDVYLEPRLGHSFVAPFAADNADMEYDESRMIRNVTYYGLNQPEAYCARNGIEITYAPGWDDGIFTEEWSLDDTKKREIPVVLSTNMLTQLGLELENEFYAECDQTKNGNGGRSYGRYLVCGPIHRSGFHGRRSRAVGAVGPACCRGKTGAGTCYSVAEFVLDPVKNRELSARREELKELVAQPNAGALDLTPGTVG